MKKSKIIKYLDGIRFKHSIIASAKKVEQNQQHLNDINVFPVPDGDTGTNMAETMRTIAEGAERSPHKSFGDVSENIADSALEGARGNSGVILAQFFQGLADKVIGKKHVETHEFALAVHGAVENAEEAISDPREGTILTVMRDWANHIKEHAHIKTDFIELLKSGLDSARQSLANTPKKLKELKKAGVVDAGAEGFVHILEGMVDFLENGKIAAIAAGSQVLDKVRHHTHNAEEAAKFQFCTQCFIKGDEIDRDELKEKLSAFGDSLIVIGTKKKARIHVHSNNPDGVFAVAEEYGEIVQTKVEDMRAQFDSKLNTQKHGIALVTDSTCDVPDKVLRDANVHVVPLHLKIKDKSFIDRVEIQPEEFYQLYAASGGDISTSQPSIASFADVYRKLANEYESVISMHITKHLSGTINGARVAAKPFMKKMQIDIIDAHSTTVGLGLVVQEAARLMQQGLAHSAIVEKLRTAVQNMRFFVSIPSLKQAIKSGRIPKAKGFIGTLLNIKPVISFDSDGKVIEAAKVMGLEKVRQKVYDMAASYAETVKNPRFGIAHVMNLDLAERYKQDLQALFRTNDIFITAASPALGAHVGFGACAIAVLGDV